MNHKSNQAEVGFNEISYVIVNNKVYVKNVFSFVFFLFILLTIDERSRTFLYAFFILGSTKNSSHGYTQGVTPKLDS